MIGIYKITNTVNGKVYIGQAQDIEERWKQHNREFLKEDSVIYLAMRKYGIENFSFEVLEECKKEELNEKEIYYIEKFNSYIHAENSNGYNMTIGGGGIRGHKHTEETKRKMRETRKGTNKRESNPMYGRTGKEHPSSRAVICENIRFECIKDCAIHYEENARNMRRWLDGTRRIPQKYIELGLHYEGEVGVYEVVTKPSKCKIICENIIFESAIKCGKYYGKTSTTILNWIRGKTKMPQEFVDKKLRFYVEEEEK